MFKACVKAVQNLWGYGVKVKALCADNFYLSNQHVEKSTYTQFYAQLMSSFFHRQRVCFISVMDSFSTIYTALSINKTNLIKDY